MCMTMLRCQETYESPKFHGKDFTLVEYMDWYSKTYGNGVFTYAKDWSGFNFPGQILLDCYFKKKVKDLNLYDDIVREIYLKHIHQKVSVGNDFYKFYVIAAVGSDKKSAFNHEMAHAFFYLDSKYRKKMKELVKKMKKLDYNHIHSALVKYGYAEKVMVDEMQAFLSTGISPIQGAADIDKSEFIKTFKDKLKQQQNVK